MKKLIVVITVIILLTPCCTVADADVLNTPHVVAERDVWLYSSDGSKLFLIPGSYYAPIVSMDDYFYYVTFNGISGRINKSEVSTLGYHTTATGTLTELKIDSEYAEFSSILLLKSPDLGSERIAEIPVSASFTFVGKYPVDEVLWYAVKYEQYFGYVKASRTNNVDIEIADFLPESPPIVEEPVPDDTDEPAVYPPDENEPSSSGDSLKIILIVGLIVPAVLVVLLLFRPVDRKRK